MDRTWHKNFKNYTEMIVKHPNYTGLFFKRLANGDVQWVVTGKSTNGQLRREWWDQKCNENGIVIEPGCYAKIAAKIHPTKKHVCQICGKELSVLYVYPNKISLKELCKYLNAPIGPYTLTIHEIVERYGITQEGLNGIKNAFKIPLNVPDKSLADYIYKNCSSRLSPGVMSNSPDRFDGFHSDGNCCRSKSDKGRSKENLQRYSQDRRVYENWADGDWKMADRLMSEFSKHNVSADHIGPISLGFCHRPKFQPMSKSENSAKNNRMSFADVKTLLNDETNGETVISWHSKFLWDSLKSKVRNDDDALKLSKLMRNNLHQILTLFAIISENGGDEFLMRYLNLDYSYADYSFEGFNPTTGTYQKVNKKVLEGKNQRNNVLRYIRIAFDSLAVYKEKENRRQYLWDNRDIESQVKEILTLIAVKNYKTADKTLKQAVSLISSNLSKKW